VDQRRKVFSIKLEPFQLLPHFDGQGGFLLIKNFKVHLHERLLEIAADVSERLHETPKIVIDEDE
jgi:hypothetical protein